MKLIKTLLSIAVMGMLLPACFLVKSKKGAADVTIPTNAMRAAALKKPLDSVIKTSPKQIKDLITPAFKSDSGLFNIYQLDEKYYLEIPDALLGKDILLASRIIKSAAENRTGNPMSPGFAGDIINEKIIRFTRGPKQNLFIKTVSFSERSSDSTANGMYHTLERSNVMPITAVFDIKAVGSNAKSSLIDISDYIANDQSLLGFSQDSKANYQLGPFQKDKSYVLGMQAFSGNLELQTLNTYTKGSSTVTYELNNSFVLLPEKPMDPRFADSRVGFFEQNFTDFDAPHGIQEKAIISRFRLEPKPEDVARYLKGELVEPLKPIVYYIDPTTPRKWIKYLVQAVNDWQKAFEKAGFKNAIYALEAPKNDKSWSLYDSKHNAIVYMPSTIENAVGPHIKDPRTGEILETHITFFHNIMTILHDWYLLQAGPSDLRARKMVFDDELMGRLIRYLISHEVGHTLGLRHNFLASSSTPVDSLRSKNYVEKHGLSPSIMDYNRFNYVAQPMDKMPVELLIPRIGAYDEWAIEWGYRWFPEGKTKEEQNTYLKKWVSDKLNKSQHLDFAGDFGMIPTDARVQMEDLGDNASKASSYGIENLKFVMRNLPEWTRTANGNYENLERVTKRVFAQYNLYIGHVLQNIRVMTKTFRVEGQPGDVFGFVSKAKKQEAVAFFNKELFATPYWLKNTEIHKKTGLNGLEEARTRQEDVLSSLVSSKTFKALESSNALAPVGEHYTFESLLVDLDKGIFTELKGAKTISAERRYLQRLYVEKLINLQNVTYKDPLQRLDVVILIKAHVGNLIRDLNRSYGSYKDYKSMLHVKDLAERLKWSMKPENYIEMPSLFPLSATPRPGAFIDMCCGGLHQFNKNL